MTLNSPASKDILEDVEKRFPEMQLTQAQRLAAITANGDGHIEAASAVVASDGLEDRR